jgi:hypothetical protein
MLDVYLIIIKIEGNLSLKCIDCILLILSSLKIKEISLIYNIFFMGYKSFKNLTIPSLNKYKKKKILWNFIISRIESAKLICKIKANGLLSFKFFIQIILYSLNFTTLIKIFHPINRFIENKANI